MSGETTAPGMDATVHNSLVAGFTNRYLERSGFDKLAFATPYDPTNPICDYTRTQWDAQPNMFSVPLATVVLGKIMHRISPKEVRHEFVQPFADHGDSITGALREFPLMLVNGHHVDLQAALTLFAAGRGVAARKSGNYDANYRDMARLSHGIVTRGIAPIVIGRPKLPAVSFMRLCQLIVNPHLSFPNTEQMRQSAIPPEFMQEYNARLKQGAVNAALQQPQESTAGMHTLWSLAPAGEPDVLGEGELTGKTITKLVKAGTLDLIKAMGCGLLPVRTKLGKGKSPTTMELGTIITPDQVTASTIHNIMADLAAFRRQNGQRNVFYEAEV